MNLDKLTPETWEIIRKWDFNTLKNASRMFAPAFEYYLGDEDND